LETNQQIVDLTKLSNKVIILLLQLILFIYKEKIMKLSAPKFVTFLVALVLVLAGVLAQLGVVAVLAQYAFWLVLAGFVVLALAVLLKDL
jgi:hypothetical protein